MIVSICIITYKRPEGLGRLLDALNHLTFSQIEPPEVEVVVVDNDITGTGIAICQQEQSGFKWRLKYETESRRGISYARNHSVALADASAEFIAIVDDDEVPEPQWLEQLLLTQKNHDADVVGGPVIPFFAERDVPGWVKRGKFFEPPSHQDGRPVPIVYTNNVLIRAQLLRQFDPPFAERFSLTGGEDAHLFMGLSRAGAKLIWAGDAIVREWIPSNRTTRKYIFQRGYRSWSTQSIVEREWYPSFVTQLIRSIKGCGLIGLGLLRLIPSPFQREEFTVIALLYICRGCGTIAGLLGFHYEEYKQVQR